MGFNGNKSNGEIKSCLSNDFLLLVSQELI